MIIFLSTTYRSFLTALLVLVTSVAFAATRTITGNWGQWSSTSTWQSSTKPVNGDNVTSSVNGLNTYVDGSINLTLTGITYTKAASMTLWSGAYLVIDGNITGTNDLTITVQSGATLIVNGSITSSNGAVSITVDMGGTLVVTGGVQAKNNITLIAGGDVDITGNVTSTNGDIKMETYVTGDLYIDGSVSANNDLDIKSDNVTHITGGVSAGNNTSFTINDTLIIDGVIDVGNSATFTSNGLGTFEAGGLTADNGTSITVSGDMYIDGDVNLGQNTTMTVNGSGTLTTTGNFTAGGGSTSYTVHGEMIVGGDLSLDGGNDVINGWGTVTTGGSCLYNTTSSSTITQNCSVTKEVALPVSLIDFTATLENSSVVLSWSTASEKDNDYFTVLRSYNGVDFEELVTMSGQGDSKDVVAYEWVDFSFAYQQAYYQLSQTDYDGTTELLGTVVVYPQEFGVAKIAVGPNPAQAGSLVKVLNAGVTGGTYTLLSIDGKYSKKGTVDSANSISLSGLNPGIYILRVAHYGSLFESKIIVR